MAVADPVPVIQATLAPMFLVSGASIFLNFLQARLFRVNDRVRALVADMRSLAEPSPLRAETLEHIALLARRQRVIRNALVFGVVTVSLTALAAILLIAPFVLSIALSGASAVIVFSLALVAFAASLVLGLVDTFLSVRMVESQVADIVRKG